MLIQGQQMEYSLLKRSLELKRGLRHRINQWDCWPVSRRIIDPNKARKLKESLSHNHQNKISIANHAISVAKTTAEKKRANQTKLLLERYGSSCYLQLLDDEPAPAENHLEEIKSERIARTAMQRRMFLDELLAKQHHVKHDHTYTSVGNEGEGTIVSEALKDEASVVPSYLISQLYENQVVLNLQQAADIEMKTRTQSLSELWHSERKLRITASIMKEVCHRKTNTSCKAFVQNKIDPKPVYTAAICYGKKHENNAVLSYVTFQQSHGIVVEVSTCGLVVDTSAPWLAASPDRTVSDSTQKDNKKGCLEVKCPLSCEKITIIEACRTVSAFCLVEQSGHIHLSKSHGYYYHIQTQMYVTKLKWCDFVVWSPLQDPFVQRVCYDPVFMEEAVLKAQKFYFEHFLPSIVPCMISTISYQKYFTH